VPSQAGYTPKKVRTAVRHGRPLDGFCPRARRRRTRPLRAPARGRTAQWAGTDRLNTDPEAAGRVVRARRLAYRSASRPGSVPTRRRRANFPRRRVAGRTDCPRGCLRSLVKFNPRCGRYGGGGGPKEATEAPGRRPSHATNGGRQSTGGAMHRERRRLRRCGLLRR
jgi:hypothetical protein